MVSIHTIRLADISEFNQPNTIDLSNPSLNWLRNTPSEDWTPIILDEGNHIIDGVHRFFVAKELGLTTIQAVYPSEMSDDEYQQFFQ